ncbi:hypothetical protein AAG570_001218 [Ranatra chinensis]|uniref:Uncharacterized protein n=1 Tax=Ranatra chinensis TaxID=642074 RepID=A0ABD0YD37_9HEMI
MERHEAAFTVLPPLSPRLPPPPRTPTPNRVVPLGVAGKRDKSAFIVLGDVASAGDTRGRGSPFRGRGFREASPTKSKIPVVQGKSAPASPARPKGAQRPPGISAPPSPAKRQNLLKPPRPDDKRTRSPAKRAPDRRQTAAMQPKERPSPKRVTTTGRPPPKQRQRSPGAIAPTPPPLSQAAAKPPPARKPDNRRNPTRTYQRPSSRIPVGRAEKNTKTVKSTKEIKPVDETPPDTPPEAPPEDDDDEDRRVYEYSVDITGGADGEVMARQERKESESEFVPPAREESLPEAVEAKNRMNRILDETPVILGEEVVEDIEDAIPDIVPAPRRQPVYEPPGQERKKQEEEPRKRPDASPLPRKAEVIVPQPRKVEATTPQPKMAELATVQPKKTEVISPQPKKDEAQVLRPKRDEDKLENGVLPPPTGPKPSPRPTPKPGPKPPPKPVPTTPEIIERPPPVEAKVTSNGVAKEKALLFLKRQEVANILSNYDMGKHKEIVVKSTTSPSMELAHPPKSESQQQPPSGDKLETVLDIEENSGSIKQLPDLEAETANSHSVSFK